MHGDTIVKTHSAKNTQGGSHKSRKPLFLQLRTSENPIVSGKSLTVPKNSKRDLLSLQNAFFKPKKFEK